MILANPSILLILYVNNSYLNTPYIPIYQPLLHGPTYTFIHNLTHLPSTHIPLLMYDSYLVHMYICLLTLTYITNIIMSIPYIW